MARGGQIGRKRPRAVEPVDPEWAHRSAPAPRAQKRARDLARAARAPRWATRLPRPWAGREMRTPSGAWPGGNRHSRSAARGEKSLLGNRARSWCALLAQSRRETDQLAAFARTQSQL